MDKVTILESSIHIMHSKGYNGTGVKELTDASNIPKGSFYNYFKSKEEYGVEALWYYYDQLSSSSLMILTDHSIEPNERIVRFYEDNVEHFKNNGFVKGCFIGNMTEEMCDTSSDIASAAEEIHKNISRKIELCLTEAKESNKREYLSDPDLLADFIVNSWQGALVRMKSEKSGKALDVFMKILNKIVGES
ncbi:MAG: TetR family transcriptional regulator C-terminal domain-containing protein [Clostridia bacterium]|nr:TetR family transcriptional regulator C-terminal domain-containing protein [Clostridia bacterium]